MRYYADVPAYFSNPKNNLERKIIESVEEFKDFIFPVSMLPVIQSSLVNVIENLIKEYPRCKNITNPKWSDDNRYASEKAKGLRKGLKNYELNVSGMYKVLTLRACRETEDL